MLKKNVGYILKNSQFGSCSNIWTEEDTAIYKSANKRLFVESMLHTFLYAIKNL